MNILETKLAESANGPSLFNARRPAMQPSHLHLVTAHDLQELSNDLAKAQVPPDLEAKLTKLAAGELGHSFIEQNCRTIIDLIVAVLNDSFKAVEPSDLERLLRVLAYVRKDDDAIPDYRPDGFIDDQKELRAGITQLAPLLQNFKAWRLRHHVPRIWSSALPESAAPQMPIER